MEGKIIHVIWTTVLQIMSVAGLTMAHIKLISTGSQGVEIIAKSEVS